MLAMLRARGIQYVMESDGSGQCIAPVRVRLSLGPLSVTAEGGDETSTLAAAIGRWNAKRVELMDSLPNILY